MILKPSATSQSPQPLVFSLDDRPNENHPDSFHPEPDVVRLSVTEAVQREEVHGLVQLRQKNAETQVVEQLRLVDQPARVEKAAEPLLLQVDLRELLVNVQGCEVWHVEYYLCRLLSEHLLHLLY